MKLEHNKRFYKKLNEDGGLMKKKFDAVGREALFSLIVNSDKDIGKTHDALIALRTLWINSGYEDKTTIKGRHNERKEVVGSGL